MNRIVLLSFAFLLCPHYMSYADMTCQAVRYSCDPVEKRIEVTNEQASCGSFDRPFSFFDDEKTGLYDPDEITQDGIVKRCQLNGTQLETHIGVGCAAYNGQVPSISIYRIVESKYHSSAERYRELLYRTNLFGGACAPLLDDQWIVTHLIVTLVKRMKVQITIGERSFEKKRTLTEIK